MEIFPSEITSVLRTGKSQIVNGGVMEMEEALKFIDYKKSIVVQILNYDEPTLQTLYNSTFAKLSPQNQYGLTNEDGVCYDSTQMNDFLLCDYIRRSLK